DTRPALGSFVRLAYPPGPSTIISLCTVGLNWVWSRRIARFRHGEGPRVLTATPCPRFTSRHLLRVGLRRFEPERHLHLSVHRRRDGEVLPRLLPPACKPVEHAEPEVAVGHERAQAPRLGQGQGLAIVRLRSIDLEVVWIGRDVAEQSQDADLHLPFPHLPSRREPVLGDPGGVRQPPVEKVAPAESSGVAGPP